MIRLMEICPHTLIVDTAYITDDNSAVQISSIHSLNEDDGNYKTYEFAPQSIVTFNENGEWSDFECIMPQIASSPLCGFHSQIDWETGTPILKVENEGEFAAVSKDGNGFVLWLSEKRTINKIIRNEIIEFYFEKDELVGIRATEQKI